MNHLPESLRSTPIHERDLAFRYGIHFEAKLIGTMIIQQPKHQLDVLHATRVTRVQFSSRRIKKVKVEVVVAIHGVKVVRLRPTKFFRKRKEWDDAQQLIISHPLYRIYYVCNDPQDLLIFSYITRDTDDAFKCHLFKAYRQDQAAQIVKVMCEAFEISPRFNNIMYPGSCEPTRKFTPDKIALPDGATSDSEALVRDWLPSTIQQLQKQSSLDDIQDKAKLRRKHSNASIGSAPGITTRPQRKLATVAEKRNSVQTEKVEVEVEASASDERASGDSRRRSKSSSSGKSQTHKTKAERSMSVFNFLPGSRKVNMEDSNSGRGSIPKEEPGPSEQKQSINPTVFPGPPPPPTTAVATAPSIPDILLNSYTAALSENLSRTIMSGYPYATIPANYASPFSFGLGIPPLPGMIPTPALTPTATLQENRHLEQEVERLKRSEDDMRRDISNAAVSSEKISLQVQAIFDKLRDIDQKISVKAYPLDSPTYSPLADRRKRSSMLPQVKADLERLNMLYEQTISRSRERTVERSTSPAASPVQSPRLIRRVSFTRSKSMDERPRLPSFLMGYSQINESDEDHESRRSEIDESDAISEGATSAATSEVVTEMSNNEESSELLEAGSSGEFHQDTRFEVTKVETRPPLHRKITERSSSIVDTTTNYNQVTSELQKRKGHELWALLRTHMLTPEAGEAATLQEERTPKLSVSSAPHEDRNRKPSAPHGLPEESKPFSQGGALRFHSGLLLETGDKHESEKKRKRSHAMNLWHYVLDNLEILKQARKESKDSTQHEYGLPNETKPISQGGIRKFHSGLRITSGTRGEQLPPFERSEQPPIVFERYTTDSLKPALKARTYSILSQPIAVGDGGRRAAPAVHFVDNLKSQDDSVLDQKTKSVSFLERMSSSSSEQGSLNIH